MTQVSSRVKDRRTILLGRREPARTPRGEEGPAVLIWDMPQVTAAGKLTSLLLTNALMLDRRVASLRRVELRPLP